MYSRPPRITPETPDSANMYARTAVISAKLRVLALPRPPYAPLYRAGPERTGLSFGGSSICAFDIRRHELDSRWHGGDRTTVGAGVLENLLIQSQQLCLPHR